MKCVVLIIFFPSTSNNELYGISNDSILKKST